VFSAIGAVAWAAGVTLLGAVLGQFDIVKNNIEAMLILVVVISLVPIAIEALQARRERKLGASNLAEEALDGANGDDAPTTRIQLPPHG
jgi:membrane-associated protein